MALPAPAAIPAPATASANAAPAVAATPIATPASAPTTGTVIGSTRASASVAALKSETLEHYPTPLWARGSASPGTSAAIDTVINTAAVTATATTTAATGTGTATATAADTTAPTAEVDVDACVSFDLGDVFDSSSVVTTSAAAALRAKQRSRVHGRDRDHSRGDSRSHGHNRGDQQEGGGRGAHGVSFAADVTASPAVRGGASGDERGVADAVTRTPSAHDSGGHRSEHSQSQGYSQSQSPAMEYHFEDGNLYHTIAVTPHTKVGGWMSAAIG